MITVISIRMFFPRFKIVLEQQSDALRAFLAVTERVEAITVAQNYLKVLVLRRKRQATARAGLLTTPLFISLFLLGLFAIRP